VAPDARSRIVGSTETDGQSGAGCANSTTEKGVNGAGTLIAELKDDA
jgi:hypothetical protein